MEKRRGHRLMNQINVVPYIDVMLVLLVIFMITAPLINPGQIELPQVGKTSDPPVAPLEVSIHTDQSLWLRDRQKTTAERKVTRNELIQAIRQKQARNPQQAVVIAADKDVRYAAVLEVMDMLQQNQVKKVGLLAKPRSP
ncbi:MAG: protein TolR [Betaproteobacteria bacterium RIFCSPLOWO2_02_64_14]|nr:MAG: protein TolR [Betaproteobacteria bacterium RIFCSPLOWO2_02_64_14]